MNDFDFDKAEKEIEISIAQAEAQVELKNKAEKLIGDPLFDDLITKAYCTNQALQYVSLLADPDQQAPEQQEGLSRDLYAIAAFQRFLRDIITRGNAMERSIASSAAALEELRSESENTGE